MRRGRASYSSIRGGPRGPRGCDPEGVSVRLRILDNGHGLGTRALFVLIRAVTRQPVLDVVKLVKYRADFYGGPMGAVTQDAMRGPSGWSVGDRELMAAFVAKTNQCAFCTRAHGAVAQRAYGDEGRSLRNLV